MEYPTMEEVEAADHLQICKWYRFLPSPGTIALGRAPEVHKTMVKKERLIMDAISNRFLQGGGMSPEISKKIGLTK